MDLLNTLNRSVTLTRLTESVELQFASHALVTSLTTNTVPPFSLQELRRFKVHCAACTCVVVRRMVKCSVPVVFRRRNNSALNISRTKYFPYFSTTF